MDTITITLWLWLTVCHGIDGPQKIDGLPNLKMVIFHGKLLNNQMVMLFGDGFILPLGHPAGSLGTLKLPW